MRIRVIDRDMRRQSGDAHHRARHRNADPVIRRRAVDLDVVSVIVTGGTVG